MVLIHCSYAWVPIARMRASYANQVEEVYTGAHIISLSLPITIGTTVWGAVPAVWVGNSDICAPYFYNPR